MSKILTLGEIMLRLSTDPGTLMTYSTNFTVWEHELKEDYDGTIGRIEAFIRAAKS